MVQTVATMVSLIVAAGAILVIAASLAEDWQSLRHALGTDRADILPVLPKHIRQVTAPRRARMVRITPENSGKRAAA